MTEFEQIYRTYFDDVYRYIRRLSGSGHVAEEVTSDTFFKAMQTIERFRGDCDVRVWLCQIAKNSYYTYLKKNSKIQSIEESGSLELSEIDESISEKIVRKDEIGRIQQILHDIREPYKEVFMWRIYGELSFRQIGQLFGKTENWACVTYHRARKMIKERLEE